MTFWMYYFSWYQGGVYGNLIASAVTSSGTVALTLWRLRKHHERTSRESRAHRERLEAHVTQEVAALHAKLDQQGGTQ